MKLHKTEDIMLMYRMMWSIYRLTKGAPEHKTVVAPLRWAKKFSKKWNRPMEFPDLMAWYSAGVEQVTGYNLTYWRYHRNPPRPEESSAARELARMRESGLYPQPWDEGYKPPVFSCGRMYRGDEEQYEPEGQEQYEPEGQIHWTIIEKDKGE